MNQIEPELLEQLEERYAEPEIPPCRVCGEELTISKAGGGEPTVFHCGSEHAKTLGGPCRDLYREDEKNGVYPPHGSVFARTCEHSEHRRNSEFVLRRHGDPNVMKLVEYVKSLSPLLDEPSLSGESDSD